MRVSLPRTRAVKALGAIAVAAGLSWFAAPGVSGRQAPAPVPTTGTSAISGVVTDAATGAPIAGASVILINVRDESGKFQDYRHPSALTDGKGRFVFADLPSAFRYEIAATRVGYNVGETRDGASIKLAEGEWKRDVAITMPRPSSISGRVTDERGEPVVGTAVRIFGRRIVAGHELVLGGSTASTDDRGMYRMAYLEPGRYYVAVPSVQSTVPGSVIDGARVLPLGGLEGRGVNTPPSSVPTARGASIDADGKHRLVLTGFATPPAGGSGPRVYPPVFYPNARTLTEAQTVEVPANGGITNVDIQLTPVTASTMSGHISGATQNAANMVLRLLAPGTENLGSGSEVATTLVEADGTFTFLNVPRGDYTLIASSVVAEINAGQFGPVRLSRSVGSGPGQGYGTQYPSAPNINFTWWQIRGGSMAWGRTPVSVGADVTNLDFPLHETTSIRGRVVVDDPSQMRPGEQFGMTLEPATADPSLGAFYGYSAGDAHEFSMTGLQPARYVLKPPFGGWRVASVVANGVDLLDTGFDGASGQNYENVVVSITKTGATISGTAHTRNGAPAAAAVILFPADPKAWVDYGFTPDRLRSVRTDSGGGYRIPTLREGDYFVIAVPVSQARAWIDPRFLAAASAQATPITLSSTTTKTQDLAITEVIIK